METVVIYNAGKSAFLAGAPRIAPDEIDYPIVSRYEAYRIDRMTLSAHTKQHWLEGYDRKYDRKRPAPPAKTPTPEPKP